MRVAHFTLGRCNPESANGVDKSVYHLSRVQASLGQEVAVFSLTTKPPVPIPGVAVITCPPVRPAVPFLTPRQYDLLVNRAPWNVPGQLVRQIAEWRPDLLHLHFVHVPPNVFLARRLSPLPYCVTIHGGLSPVAQRRSRWKKRLFKLLFEQQYLNNAAFLHAISEQDVQGLRAYGVSNRTVLAPNGIDVEPVSTAVDDAELRRLDDSLPSRRIFLYLGRVDPQQKGLDLLMQAFAACRPANAALILAGPDWRGGQRQLDAMARSLGIADCVYFAGPVFAKRKTDLLRAATVFVHTSRWEAGVPFSVLEAAALDRPCLLTEAADPAGVMARGGAAVSVGATVAGIEDGLRQMSSLSPDALHAMGARAREVVTRNFSWRRTAEILIDAYKQAVVPCG